MDTTNIILKLISEVLDISRKELSLKSSPQTIGNWDSIKHMDIIASLEEEFSIIFSEEEIFEMMNIEIINIIVLEKIKN
jgi:acyl carrier protein